MQQIASGEIFPLLVVFGEFVQDSLKYSPMSTGSSGLFVGFERNPIGTNCGNRRNFHVNELCRNEILKTPSLTLILVFTSILIFIPTRIPANGTCDCYVRTKQLSF